MKFDFNRALKWSSIDNLIKLGYSFFVPIILARLLGPEPYGIIAMAYVVVGLSQVFIEFGVGDAIVRSRKINDEFLSSIFWFNFGIGTLVFLTILLITPFVTDYFQEEILNKLIPILSSLIFFQVVTIVISALMRRKGDFYSIAKASFISKLIASILAIVLAINDYGIYSIVALTVSQVIIYSIVLLWIYQWFPSLVFKVGEIASVIKFTLSI